MISSLYAQGTAVPASQFLTTEKITAERALKAAKAGIVQNIELLEVSPRLAIKNTLRVARNAKSSINVDANKYVNMTAAAFLKLAVKL